MPSQTDSYFFTEQNTAQPHKTFSDINKTNYTRKTTTVYIKQKNWFSLFISTKNRMPTT